MKIFKFNPETGKRGELIKMAARWNYTSASIAFAAEHGMIEPIPCKIPKNDSTHEWTAHIDAGDIAGNSFRCDEWICFCYDKWYISDDESIWLWAVLPPSSLVKSIT